MKLTFAATLFATSVAALKTEALLKQNFDDVFGTTIADAPEDNIAGSEAYWIDNENGDIYETDDNTTADDLNLGYAY